jgi:hypothetical protein
MKKFFLLILLFSANAIAQTKTAELIPQNAFFVGELNLPKIIQSATPNEIMEYDVVKNTIDEKGKDFKNKSIDQIGIDFSQPIYYFSAIDSAKNIMGTCYKINNLKLIEKLLNVDNIKTKFDVNKWTVRYEYHNFIFENENWLIYTTIWGDWKKIDKEIEKILGPEPGIFGGDNYLEELDSETMAKQNEYYDRRDQISDSLEKIEAKAIATKFIQDIEKGVNICKNNPKFSPLESNSDEGLVFVDIEKLINQLSESDRPPYVDVLKNISMNVKGQSLDKNLRATYMLNFGPKEGEFFKAVFSQPVSEALVNAIPQNALGIMTANYNFKEAYERLRKASVDFLDTNDLAFGKETIAFAAWNIISEFIDMDKLFSTFKGNVFMSFNGMQNVKYTAIESVWNENDYTYTDEEVEREDVLPTFTYGFASDNPEILEKILHLIKLSTREDTLFEGENGVYTAKKAFFNNIDLYVLNKNGVLVMTNDVEYKNNFLSGKNHLDDTRAKKILEAKYFYADLDLEKVCEQAKTSIHLDPKYLHFVNEMQAIVGKANLNAVSLDDNKMNVALDYSFKNDKNGIHHLLHIINSLYLMDKNANAAENPSEENDAPNNETPAK